jgi:hypothetical protein
MARRPRPVAISRPILAVVSAGFVFVTSLLVWLGAVVAVRGERVREGRVDVIVERRVFGLVSIRAERLPDVVKAIAIPRRGRRIGGARAGSQLRLTLRDGREWTAAPVMFATGTLPDEMAPRIQEFLDHSTAPALRLHWTPWLVATLAVPFLLICLLLAAVWVNVLRRALGLGGPVA